MLDDPFYFELVGWAVCLGMVGVALLLWLSPRDAGDGWRRIRTVTELRGLELRRVASRRALESVADQERLEGECAAGAGAVKRGK